MNSRQVLNQISRSRSLSEQQRLAQDAIAALEPGSLRELFTAISRSTSCDKAAGLAHMTIDALNRDEAESQVATRVTVDEIMAQMKTTPIPAYDGWGEVPLNADGRALMEKARSNYSQRQRKAKRRQDAIDKALADEPIGSGYSVAKPSNQVMPGAGYHF